MNGNATVTQESELILRRLLEGLPAWGLLLPVAFALVVLFLILFFRQQETVGDLFRRAHVPAGLVGWVGLAWTLGLFAYVGILLATALSGREPDPTLVLAGAVPLAAFPLLLGLFIAVMLCLRKPRRLVAVAVLGVVGGAYLVVGRLFLPVFGWWVLLAPVLAIALVYVGLMYVRDAHTIHPLWAAFLGLLRCVVYCTLAAVFLLPGCQTYQTTETHSKVLVVFDVSGSMTRTKDDRPEPGQDPRTLLTRQGKVVKFLTDPGPGNLAWLDRIQAHSPVTAYRFGAVLDDVEVQQFLGGRKWTGRQWSAWLNPDKDKIELPKENPDHPRTEAERIKLRVKLANLYEDLAGGTNVSGSALQAAVREAGSLIQAIIIVSDGRSNLGSAETFRELRARAGNPKRPFHIITVGVGEYRQPVSIRIEELGAPQQARPDDKFPVVVPVVGDGLRDEPFNVTLEAQRVVKKGDRYEPVVGDKLVLPGEGKFAGGGDHPFGEVKFEVDIRALRGIKPGDESKDDLVEGTWEFRARVPRHRLEAFADAEHVSKRPARVVVQKRKLRVLLFAGGPGRDYQFLRTLFYREVQEKRMDLSIYLQSAPEKDVDQDVEAERLLTHFPDRPLGEAPGDKAGGSLSDFDILVAFDPDWSKLDTPQLKLLEEWVRRGGGFIFVAGPVNSYQLARPGGQDIRPLLTILPVTVKDSRLHGLGIGHDASRPYALNFPDRARQFDFLKLQDEGDDPLAGWNKLFWGEGQKPEAGKDVVPRRGFFNYYPVDKVKPGTEVLATFAGPAESRINEGRDEQPFLATMPYSAGRCVYLGAGETWRLRQFKHTYFERFWVKLARYAGSGTLSKLSRYGVIPLPSRVRAGLIAVEAQVLGADLNPLPRDSRPAVRVVRPEGFDPKTDRDTPDSFELKAKNPEGEWNGWFAGTFKAWTPGDYTLKIPIPGTGQYLTHDLTVYRPDPETDVTKPDHGHLYQLATSARPVLNRLPEDRRREILKVLRTPPEAGETKEAGGKDELRLFFPLTSAGIVPELITKVEASKESTKGRLQDLWDQGVESGLSLRADRVILAAALAIGLLAFAILLFIRRPWLALAFLGGALAAAGAVMLATWLWAPPWAELPLDMSFVLAVVVGLLATEWLTRKLLKLA